MAGTPAAVSALLAQVWEPAKARAATNATPCARRRSRTAQTHPIEPWDWRYYAEKVRKAHYGFDDAAIKPYFTLDRMLDAAFDTANRLFGMRFIERPDLPTYHEDVRVFEVRGRDDDVVGLFLYDNFARPDQARWRLDERLSLPVDASTARRSRSSSTTTTSRRARRASRRCSRSTTRARCSTSSATGCTACCRT